MSGSGDGRSQGSVLGRCPTCEELIPSGNLLIRYETSEGWPKMFAECPVCEEPVHPE